MQCDYIIYIKSDALSDPVARISKALESGESRITVVAVLTAAAAAGKPAGDILLLVKTDHASVAALKHILDDVGIAESWLYQHFDW